MILFAPYVTHACEYVHIGRKSSLEKNKLDSVKGVTWCDKDSNSILGGLYSHRITTLAQHTSTRRQLVFVHIYTCLRCHMLMRLCIFMCAACRGKWVGDNCFPLASENLSSVWPRSWVRFCLSSSIRGKTLTTAWDQMHLTSLHQPDISSSWIKWMDGWKLNDYKPKATSSHTGVSWHCVFNCTELVSTLVTG